MLNYVRSLFTSQSEELPEPPSGLEAVPVAAAVLLLEAALMDDSLEAVEEQAILSLLAQKFHCTTVQAHELLMEAESHLDEKDHFYHYTKVIKDNLDENGRKGILEMLWEVILSDGDADEYETNLMRRMCGLLYINDKDSGDIKHRVQEKLARAAQPVN